METYEWEVAWAGPPTTIRGKNAYKIEQTGDAHDPLRLWIDGKNGDDDEDSFSIAGPDLLAQIMSLAGQLAAEHARIRKELLEWIDPKLAALKARNAGAGVDPLTIHDSACIGLLSDLRRTLDKICPAAEGKE